jgi:BirA family biotin operon repressor/biotin-[acetyl-CoA-carboxylase] ligase
LNFTILHYDILPSTNTEAARQAASGAAEGVCVVARQQTAGRGRRSRSWFSPPDAGLYLSLILRPRFEQKFWALLTLAAALAVCETIKNQCNLITDIKWANDVHTVAGKKLAGILAETAQTLTDAAVILGIGVNLKKEAVAPELIEVATALEIETRSAPDKENFLAALLQNFCRLYDVLHKPNGNLTIIEQYSLRSSYAAGKFVRVSLENETLTGETCGLNAAGALRVRTKNGIIKTVYAGDVVALRQQS